MLHRVLYGQWVDATIQNTDLTQFNRDYLLFILYYIILYYAPDIHKRGHYKMRCGVCPSVCRVPRPNNSRTERRRKAKTGTIEAHHTSIS